MRSAEEYFNMNKRQFDGLGYFVNEEDFKNAISEAQREAIRECAEAAKTIKTGNSGSWYDASVDKQSILQLLNNIQ